MIDFDSVFGFQLSIIVSIMCQKGIIINEYLEIWQAKQSYRINSDDRDDFFSLWMVFAENTFVYFC